MATEGAPVPPLTLPSYPEMILAAIDSLNSPNGSNKSTISKYIESKYGRLPAGHNALVSHHLNRMKESGELIFWKNNYIKNHPDLPPRRGRGRPPKPKNLPGLPSTGMTLSLAKPKGRPPMDPSSSPPPKAAKKDGLPGSPRGRGRPRKTNAEPTPKSGRPRGRPPKVQATTVEGSSE